MMAPNSSVRRVKVLALTAILIGLALAPPMATAARTLQSTDEAGSSSAITPDSECVEKREGTTLKPSGEGTGWSRKYKNLDICFDTCTRADGYMYIVQNTETGDCYCYEADGEYRWVYENVGDDVMYDISTCFDLPMMSCPDDDQPGWIDQPKNMRCKNYLGKFEMEKGYKYTDWEGKQNEYKGTLSDCKRICVGMIVGDIDSIPGSCGWVEYNENKKSCNVYRSCEKLTEADSDGRQASIYCGMT